MEFKNGCFTVTEMYFVCLGLKLGKKAREEKLPGEVKDFRERGSVKKEVFSYLMSQPHSNDKEVLV